MAWDDDTERYDRARVALILIEQPGPPSPVIDGGWCIHAFLPLARAREWIRAGRPGSAPLPSQLDDEGWALPYGLLVGWEIDPHAVGLLTELPENPYAEPGNRSLYGNGQSLSRSAAGKAYRRYVEACRKRARQAVDGVPVP